MISKLIEQLEAFKGRIENYEDLISQILIRNPKEAKLILKLLLTYLKANPDIRLIKLSELSSTGLVAEFKHLKFIITIGFKCEVCCNPVSEDCNLTATNQPYRSNKNPVCEMCWGEAEKDYEREMDYDYYDYDVNEGADDFKKSKNDKEIEDLPF